jgi:hypothetical protein
MEVHVESFPRCQLAAFQCKGSGQNLRGGVCIAIQVGDCVFKPIENEEFNQLEATKIPPSEDLWSLVHEIAWEIFQLPNTFNQLLGNRNRIDSA